MTSTLTQTPFGEGSTAAEVIEGVDLSGKQAVVTGAASGLALRPPVPSRAPAPWLPARSAARTSASAPRPASARRPGTTPAMSARSISPTGR